MSLSRRLYGSSTTGLRILFDSADSLDSTIDDVENDCKLPFSMRSVYDPVGMIIPSLKVIAWNSRIVVVGFAGGNIEKIPSNLSSFFCRYRNDSR